MTDHKTTAFSAAPWSVSRYWDTSVTTHDGLLIDIHTNAPIETRRATARLIAAAPALLAMLGRAYEALSIAGQNATAADCATVLEEAQGAGKLLPYELLSIASGERQQYGETGGPADRLSGFGADGAMQGDTSIERQGCTQSLLTEASDRLFAIRQRFALTHEGAVELRQIEALIRAALAAG